MPLPGGRDSWVRPASWRRCLGPPGGRTRGEVGGQGLRAGAYIGQRRRRRETGTRGQGSGAPRWARASLWLFPPSWPSSHSSPQTPKQRPLTLQEGTDIPLEQWCDRDKNWCSQAPLFSGQLRPCCPCLQPLHTGPAPTTPLSPGRTRPGLRALRGAPPQKGSQSPRGPFQAHPTLRSPGQARPHFPDLRPLRDGPTAGDWVGGCGQGQVKALAVSGWAPWAGDPSPEMQHVSGRAKCGTRRVTFGAWPAGDIGESEGHGVWEAGPSAGLGGHGGSPRGNSCQDPGGVIVSSD